MSSVSKNWQSLYQDIQDEWGKRLDETSTLRLANRVLDDIRGIVDLSTTIRVAQINYIADSEKYLLPSDHKTSGAIDLHYHNRLESSQTRPFEYDEPMEVPRRSHFKWYTPAQLSERSIIDAASLADDYGTEFLQIVNAQSDSSATFLHDCDATTEWAGTGGAGNLTADEEVKFSGSASINFDLTSATTAIMTATLATAVDLTDFQNNGIVFLAMWLPTAPSSIAVRIGSSASAYWSGSVTTQKNEAAFDIVRENELALDFNSLTATGSPTISSIVHVQVRLTFAAATTDTDFRLDHIKVYEPVRLDYEYYSKHIAKTAAGVWGESLSVTPNNADVPLMNNEDTRGFVRAVCMYLGEKFGDDRTPHWKLEYGLERYLQTGELTGWIGWLQKKHPSRRVLMGSSYW